MARLEFDFCKFVTKIYELVAEYQISAVTASIIIHGRAVSKRIQVGYFCEN